MSRCITKNCIEFMTAGSFYCRFHKYKLYSEKLEKILERSKKEGDVSMRVRCLVDQCNGIPSPGGIYCHNHLILGAPLEKAGERAKNMQNPLGKCVNGRFYPTLIDTPMPVEAAANNDGYKEYLNEAVSKGLKQIEEGKIVSYEEAKVKWETRKALRYNSGKLPLNLVPPEWVEGLAKVLDAGAKKYAPNNWKLSKGTEDHESFLYDRKESLKRHLLAFDKGEETDKETGMPHMLLIAWNALVHYTYGLKD